MAVVCRPHLWDDRRHRHRGKRPYSRVWYATGNVLKDSFMAEKYGPPSRKTLRRRKRRAENDFYAQDARFWVDKIKSADRTMVHDQPVDRLAHRMVHPRAHELP